MIRFSEHNTTLNQIRATYQKKKLPQTKGNNFLKSIVDLNPTCQMMLTIIAFFRNSAAFHIKHSYFSTK